MKRYSVRLLEDAVRFIRRLPVKLRAKVLRGIGLLEAFGPELPMPHARLLKGTNGLRELRVKLASDIVRMFYFHHSEDVFIVTSGYVKKSDRTDSRELQKAVRLMKTYEEGDL